MIALFLHLGLQFFQLSICVEFFAAMFVVGLFAVTWRVLGVNKW